MPEDESQPETITNYGSIPTGDAYREQLKRELEDLISAQEKHPTQYKQRRIDTISARLGISEHGDRAGARRKPYRTENHA